MYQLLSVGNPNRIASGGKPASEQMRGYDGLATASGKLHHYSRFVGLELRLYARKQSRSSIIVASGHCIWVSVDVNKVKRNRDFCVANKTVGRVIYWTDKDRIAGSGGYFLMMRANLDEVVDGVWRAFGNADILDFRVSPAVPILFFGDLDAYHSSRSRVLTVGLNPSLHEFPPDSPYRRFPLAETVSATNPDRYLDALSEYFRIDPYSSWFSAFEPMLNSLEASYYDGQPSTVLHTDICSPVATKPTWRELEPADRKTLEEDGIPLWHSLLKTLRPQVVLLSIARPFLARIQFKALGEWKVLHVFERTKDGGLRKQPIKVSARWYEISGGPSFLIFVRAAQKPLGRLGNAQKLEAGAIVMEALGNGG